MTSSDGHVDRAAMPQPQAADDTLLAAVQYVLQQWLCQSKQPLKARLAPLAARMRDVAGKLARLPGGSPAHVQLLQRLRKGVAKAKELQEVLDVVHSTQERLQQRLQRSCISDALIIAAGTLQLAICALCGKQMRVPKGIERLLGDLDLTTHFSQDDAIVIRHRNIWVSLAAVFEQQAAAQAAEAAAEAAAQALLAEENEGSDGNSMKDVAAARRAAKRRKRRNAERQRKLKEAAATTAAAAAASAAAAAAAAEKEEARQRKAEEEQRKKRAMRQAVEDAYDAQLAERAKQLAAERERDMLRQERGCEKHVEEHVGEPAAQEEDSKEAVTAAPSAAAPTTPAAPPQETVAAAAP